VSPMTKIERVAVTSVAMATAFAIEHWSPSLNIAVNILRSFCVGYTVTAGAHLAIASLRRRP
jgi:hypothetical protein